MGKIIEIALEGLFLYFLYRLVFDFIIPVYRSTKKVRKHMRDIQSRMQERSQQEQQQQNYANPSPRFRETSKPKKEKKGEYIDYEEVESDD